MLRLDLAKRLYSGKTAKYRLRFHLKDPGGAATRDLRVGDCARLLPGLGVRDGCHARAAPSGSSSRQGFDVQVQAGRSPPPTTDGTGRVVFQTGKLPSR